MRCISLVLVWLGVILLLPVSALEETPENQLEFVVLADYKKNLELNPLYAVMKDEMQIFTAVHEGLSTYEPQYNLTGDAAIAESWEISEDRRVFRFTIRKKAYYSNGDKILASHIRNTWLRIIKLGKDAPFSSFLDIILNAEDYRLGKVSADKVGIVAVSDDILEVRLLDSTAHFITLICHSSFSVLHPSVLYQRDFWELDSIPSSGPYQIIEKSRDELILEKNEYYWDAASTHIPRIRIILNSNKSEKSIAEDVNNGLIDWVISSNIDHQELDNSSLIVISPAFETSFLQFNLTAEPWTNVRIREALLLLLPWKQIQNRELWLLPALTIVPPMHSYPAPSREWEQDIEKAYEILAEEGYSPDNPLPEILIPLPETAYMKLEQILVEAWEPVTKAVDITRLSAEQYYQIQYSGNGTAVINSWIGDFADPLAFLDLWRKNSSLNTSSFQNSEFDSLLQQAAGKHGIKRYEILAQAEQLLLDSHVVIPLEHSFSVNIIDREYISGWYPNPLDIHPFKYLHFSGSRKNDKAVMLPKQFRSRHSPELLRASVLEHAVQPS